MATLTATSSSERSAGQTSGFPAASLRFEWAFAIFTLWVVGGLYLDGWAHSHGQVDNTFFTPWHGLLYAGVGAIAVFLFINQWRGMDQGYPLARALPVGYRWSLVGAGLFLFGGGLDLVWHTVFGFEVGVETLLSPTHLLLATSGILMVSGPMRSAFARLDAGAAHGWRTLGPLLIASLAAFSILTFFTSFAHPIGDYYAAAQPGPDANQFTDLYVMNADGSGQTRLTTDDGQLAWGGSWSPDGSKIVYTQGDPASDDSTLIIANADGSGAKPLADIPGAEYRASWSPDGKQIVFVTDHDGSADLAVINADGSSFRPLTQTGAREYGPVWSPDGSKIAYTSNQDGDNHIYVMNADGSNIKRLTFDGRYNTTGTWTPDSQHVIFSSDHDESTDLYQVDLDGSHLTRLTFGPDADQWPSFSADGKTLLFQSWRSDNADIYALDAACLGQAECDAKAVNLTHNHALRLLLPQPSPDGSKILFTAGGWPTRVPDFYNQALGIAGILVQSVVMMGLVLLLVKRWQLPFGAILLLLGVNGVGMTIFNDHESLIPAILLSALLVDILLWLLKPSTARLRFYAFALLTPMVVYAAYYGALQLNTGIGWTIHLWLGSIFMAGIFGLFAAFLLLNPLVRDPAEGLTLER